MKIVRVEATPLKIPISYAALGIDKPGTNNLTHVEVETDSGLVGYGVTSITQSRPVSEAVNSVLGPAIIDMDPLAHEKIWDVMYWTATPWGQTGYASHAISAIDLALWDIKGKALDMPVWRILGAARDRVPIYATCGFSFLDDDELVDVVKHVVADGFRGIKLQVGRFDARPEKGAPSLVEIIAGDIRRVGKVREAIGPDIELAVDAGCCLDLLSARRLCENIQQLDIAFFEEPIRQNDVRLLAQLRQLTSIPLSAGQNEGLGYRFRDMLLAEAVDFIQPNVIITGGLTECLRIAGLASGFNMKIAGNGGGAPMHNVHLQAGVSNGTAVEYQYKAVAAMEVLYGQAPRHENGCMIPPDAPGHGLSIDPDVVRNCVNQG